MVLYSVLLRTNISSISSSSSETAVLKIPLRALRFLSSLWRHHVALPRRNSALRFLACMAFLLLYAIRAHVSRVLATRPKTSTTAQVEYGTF